MELNLQDRVNILGVGISPVNINQTLDSIRGWIERREKKYICVTPVHSIMDCYSDSSLGQIYNDSGLTTPDGMPLVAVSTIFMAVVQTTAD